MLTVHSVMSAARPWSRPIAIVPFLIPVCGLLAIAGISGWINAPMLGAVCKPLTTLLIALHASQRASSDAVRRRTVLTGLLVSVTGEFVMISPSTYVVGLCLFVVAQLVYLSISVKVIGLVRPNWIHLAHALPVSWAIVMWSARPTAFFLAAATFMTVLGLMSAQAETWWWRSRRTRDAAVARAAALGGLFWLCADLTWTFSNFVVWVRGTFVVVLICYWLAQWHLASMIGAGEAATASLNTDAGTGHLRTVLPR